jgi:hypothetical protein
MKDRQLLGLKYQSHAGNNPGLQTDGFEESGF